MLKKILSSLLVVLMIFTVVGCSSNNQENDKSSQNNQQNNTSSSNDDTSKREESNVLIAYFSKTGNTKEIAQKIQGLTEGALIEIKPVEAYPDSYQETVTIAENEKDQNSRPKINVDLESIDQYETIFIGYPIWWHDAPMVIYTFLEQYDFSGKKVVPFCTSGGSDIEESISGIKNAIEGATLLDGLTANNIDDVELWLKEIGVLE